MIWYEKLTLKMELCNNMWSGFLDLILIPVQLNSIRPPGSRSGLVLKRDVSSLSQTFRLWGGRKYISRKKSGPPPLCLLILTLTLTRSPISRGTRLSESPERQKLILGFSEAETDQYCRFMSVMFAMNRQRFDERDQRYSNMHACNLVTDSLEQATWCYNWTPYPAHPSRLQRTSPAERVES